jgi:4-oxalocrotonate tautomerase
MPTIHIELFEGRTVDQKRAFAKEVSELSARVLGGSASGVDVIFVEVKRQDWATGGVLWSDQAKPPAAAG